MKNPKQHREVWRGAPLADRLKHMSGQYLVHSSVQKILDSIQAELVCNSARNLASGILVIAESGVGKSALIKHLMRLHPVRVQKDVTLHPMVAFKIPKRPSAKSLAEALLRALGDPDYKSGSADHKFERIKVLLTTCGCKIVAIDDFQDVPARRKDKGIAEISDWLRDLCEIEFPGVILALGTPPALVVRDSNVQLKRRMTTVHQLPVFDIASKANAEKYVEAMDGLVELMPLAESSKNNHHDVYPRILIASSGRFDHIIKLLVKAVIVVVNEGGERMEMQHLKKAFEMLHEDGSLLGNAFDESLGIEELRKKWSCFFGDPPPTNPDDTQGQGE